MKTTFMVELCLSRSYRQQTTRDGLTCIIVSLHRYSIQTTPPNNM